MLLLLNVSTVIEFHVPSFGETDNPTWIIGFRFLRKSGRDSLVSEPDPAGSVPTRTLGPKGVDCNTLSGRALRLTGYLVWAGSEAGSSMYAGSGGWQAAKCGRTQRLAGYLDVIVPHRLGEGWRCAIYVRVWIYMTQRVLKPCGPDGSPERTILFHVDRVVTYSFPQIQLVHSQIQLLWSQIQLLRSNLFTLRSNFDSVLCLHKSIFTGFQLLEVIASMENIGSCDTVCTSKQWRAEEAIAGNAEALEAVRELITFPIYYSKESQKLGLKWHRGLLLYGPPGTGKTSLVRAVVRECGAHLIVISPHSVHRAHVGESERILREAFAEASSHASSGKPSIIFIDEIDALCPRRDSRREQDIRVASQLFALMDANKPLSTSSHVVVVASTNRVDTIDPALRRSGRFDAEVEVTTPSEDERLQILKLYSRKLPLDPNVDLQAIAVSCNGYVGADLEALCREATLSASRRSTNGTNDGGLCHLTVDDWNHARSVVGPSITRGVTVEIPKVSWEDIGGLNDLKKKLQQAVEWPIKHADTFARLGISPARGILLHGPPGCSKTTLAKAAAHAAQASLFSLSGAELYSMYVGEGEALLRNTFQRARLAAPSIIFFDEADVVASKRGGSASSNTVVGERLLSTLLTEMDGLEQAKGILVLAATNRPHAIDAALMRPGRFDLVLYVPPPDLEARHEILRVHTRKMKLGDDVDLRRIAEGTTLFTGAELEGLCREAGMVALREDISATVVCGRHFEAVRESLNPALTRQEVDVYASFMKNPSWRLSHEVEPSSKQRQYMQKLPPVVKDGIVAFLVVGFGCAVAYLMMDTDQRTHTVPNT